MDGNNHQSQSFEIGSILVPICSGFLSILQNSRKLIESTSMTSGAVSRLKQSRRQNTAAQKVLYRVICTSYHKIVNLLFL